MSYASFGWSCAYLLVLVPCFLFACGLPLLGTACLVAPVLILCCLVSAGLRFLASRFLLLVLRFLPDADRPRFCWCWCGACWSFATWCWFVASWCWSCASWLLLGLQFLAEGFLVALVPFPCFLLLVLGQMKIVVARSLFHTEKHARKPFFYRKNITFLPCGQVGFVQTAPQWLYHFLFMLDFYRTAKGGLWIFTVRPRGVCGTFFTEKIQKKSQKTKKIHVPHRCVFGLSISGLRGPLRDSWGPGLQLSGLVFFLSVNLGPQGTSGGLLGTPGI